MTAAMRAWALVAAVAAGAASCTSAPVAAPQGGEGPMGGVGVELWYARTDTRQYEYYVVRPDGGFSVAGGMKAFERQPEWTGRLQDDEAKRLRAIVDAAGWLTADDPSRTGANTPVAEITLRVPGGERELTIEGKDPQVEQAVELLSTAARRRFDRFMQRLPEAGVQKR